LGNRPAFLDPHRVADGELVLLVVRVVFLRAAHGFLHRRVGETPVDAHDNGLVLLVADDDALERTFRHLEPLTSSSTWRAAWLLASRRPSAWRISFSSRSWRAQLRFRPRLRP